MSSNNKETFKDLESVSSRLEDRVMITLLKHKREKNQSICQQVKKVSVLHHKLSKKRSNKDQNANDEGDGW